MKKTLPSLSLHTLDSNTISQDYTQWSLPTGTKARLGKGRISDVLNPPEIVYSPDGKCFAVASAIGIWIYDAQTTEELNLLTGHSLDVTSVSFSPDGSILASASGDNTVHLWDVTTGKLLLTLTDHRESVNTCVFSQDGKTLVSASSDGTLLFWDLTSERLD